MGLAGIAYLFMTIYSVCMHYPSGSEFRELAYATREAMLSGPWVLVLYYFFMTVAELFICRSGSLRVESCPQTHAGPMPGPMAQRDSRGQPSFSGSARLSTTNAPYGWHGLCFLVVCPHFDGRDVLNAQMALKE